MEKNCEEMEVTIKKECPYCNSKNIESTGNGHGLGNQPLKFLYHCKECNRPFRVIEG